MLRSDFCREVAEIRLILTQLLLAPGGSSNAAIIAALLNGPVDTNGHNSAAHNNNSIGECSLTLLLLFPLAFTKGIALLFCVHF